MKNLIKDFTNNREKYKDEKFEMKNKKEMIFYPHRNMQNYMEYFTTNSKHITIADGSKYDVQTLLNESAVLVTDYSSVFFDFANLKRPMLFYMYDLA